MCASVPTHLCMSAGGDKSTVLFIRFIYEYACICTPRHTASFPHISFAHISFAHISFACVHFAARASVAAHPHQHRGGAAGRHQVARVSQTTRGRAKWVFAHTTHIRTHSGDNVQIVNVDSYSLPMRMLAVVAALIAHGHVPAVYQLHTPAQKITHMHSYTIHIRTLVNTMHNILITNACVQTYIYTNILI